MTREARGSDLRLLAGTVGVFAVLAFLLVVARPEPPAPPLSVRADHEDGAMALRLWLERLGYDTRQVLSEPIQLAQIDVLFVLNPFEPYTDRDVDRIADWVAAGNTLIAAGYGSDVLNQLLAPYDLRLTYAQRGRQQVAHTAPVLAYPPFPSLETEVMQRVDTDRDDVLLLMVHGDLPIVASVPHGTGRVWVSGVYQPFTNRSLHDDASARFLLNLIAHVPRGAVLGFDEVRHGYRETPHTLSAWLFTTPPGWGVLVLVGVSILFLALRGRRFGRAVPLEAARLRREPVEYIQAMANLFRRSGERGALLAHYRTQFKRRVSERYGLDARTDDVEWLRLLVYREPSVDEAALRDLLRRLAHTSPTEQELVTTARDADDMLHRLI